MRESPSDVPHPGLSGNQGKDGYEYIKWPEDDPVDWYRKPTLEMSGCVGKNTENIYILIHATKIFQKGWEMYHEKLL